MSGIPGVLSTTDSTILARDIGQAVSQARQARAVTGVLPQAVIRPVESIRPAPHGVPDGGKVEAIA